MSALQRFFFLFALVASLVFPAGPEAFAAGGASTSAAKGKDNYNYIDYGLAIGSRSKGTGKASGKKKKTKKKAEVSTALPEQAQAELAVKSEEKSSEVLPTPATVVSSVEPVADIYVPSSFQAGLSLQPYRPSGHAEVVDMQPYDLGGLGVQPMVALEIRWLPFHFQDREDIQVGVFVSGGYAQHPFQLKSQAGSFSEKARLNTLKSQAGLAAVMPVPHLSGWFLSGQVGGGQIQSIQSASTAFANQSSQANFASVSFAGEKPIGEVWTARIAYDYRHPLSAEKPELGLQRHNFLIGLLGSFR